MNWQAVIDSLRYDAKEIQKAMAAVPKAEIASNAMVGTSALLLNKLADALQMGLNTANKPPPITPS